MSFLALFFLFIGPHEAPLAKQSNDIIRVDPNYPGEAATNSTGFKYLATCRPVGSAPKFSFVFFVSKSDPRDGIAIAKWRDQVPAGSSVQYDHTHRIAEFAIADQIYVFKYPENWKGAASVGYSPPSYQCEPASEDK